MAWFLFVSHDLMNLWQKFQRAEYQSQPLQLPRRFWRTLTGVTSSRTQVQIRLPWGMPITVNPREAIGRSIVVLNTLDLPVTETIWRLVDDGASCADIGANIGYMTSVMAARLRAGGTVYSFEPVPEIAEDLENHVQIWRGLTNAKIEVHRLAIAEVTGQRVLHLPPNFSENRGLGMLPDSARSRDESSGARALTVCCKRLDEFFATAQRVDLLKVDVEGCENQVFQGAENLLRKGRIRDIVFEEYNPAPSAESIKTLRRHGYSIFLVARSRQGPVLLSAEDALPDDFDPPTFLATTDPARAQKHFVERRWLSLRRRRQG
jgi:FkbM family methyltransferase